MIVKTPFFISPYAGVLPVVFLLLAMLFRRSRLTSNTVTVEGINTAAAISITGGTYSVQGGAYTSVPGTVTGGQTVTVRLTSSVGLGATTSAVVTIGGVTGSFDVSTEALDTTPDAFLFVTRTDVKPNDNRRSTPATVITGFNSPAVITVSGNLAMYNINGGEFTASPGGVNNGDAIRAHHRASAAPGGVTVSTVTIGGVIGTFTTVTCVNQAENGRICAPF